MSGASAPPQTFTTNWAVPGTIGSTTPNTGSFTNLTNNGTLVTTPRATQTLTATSTIASNANIIPISSASSITLTSNPQIAAGSNGQRLTLVNVGAFVITIVNGAGLNLGTISVMPTVTLDPGEIINLVYLTALSAWVYTDVVRDSVFLPGTPTTLTASLNTSTIQLANCAFVDNATRPRTIQASRSTSQTINPSATTTVLYTTESVDTDSLFNNTTSVATVNIGNQGLYLVSATVQFNSLPNAARFSLGVYRNGVETRIDDQYAIAGEFPLLSGSTQIVMNAGDTVDVRIIAYNTGSFSLFPDGALNTFRMCRIG